MQGVFFPCIFAMNNKNVKRLLTLILLLAFSAQSFSQGILLLNFYFHRAYIAKNQCENRFRPMLHCNGKCVLAKKLKQQEKKEQQNPELKLQGKAEVVSSRSFFITQIVLPENSSPYHAALKTAATTDRSSAIFHPPCC